MVTMPKEKSERVKLAFGKFAEEYEIWAGPQRQIANHLMELALKYWTPQRGDKVLDMGAGTGFIYDALSREKLIPPDFQFMNLDISAEMLGLCRMKGYPGNIQGDILALPFKTASFGVLISSFCIQWIKDLTPVFKQVMKVLGPRGWFFLAVPVEGSFQEFNQFVGRVGDQSGFNISPLQFPKVEVIRTSLEEGGLEVVNQCEESFAFQSSDLREVLRFLRYAGASRFFKSTRKGNFMRFSTRLAKSWTPIPLTFHSLFVVARTPA